MVACRRRFRRAFSIQSSVFRRNCRISRAALHGIAVRELSVTTTETRRQAKQKLFLAGFLAVNEQLMLSNLIEMAMRSL